MYTGIFSWYMDVDISRHYVTLLGFILALFVFQLVSRGLFKLVSPYNWIGELFQLTRVSFYTFMVTAGILFMLKTSVNYSRVVIGLFFVGLLLSSWVLRLVKRGIIAYLASQKVITKNVLIVGAGKIGHSLQEKLESSRSLGYQVVGYVDDHKVGDDVRGRLADIESVIDQFEVDEIIVTIPSERATIYELLKSVKRFKINVKIIPELFDLVTTKVGYDQVDPFPYVQIGTKLSAWDSFMKRTIDVVLSFVLIIITLPVFAGIWCAQKFISPGPAIFKQWRIGKDGKKFYIYKFRSMVMDAENKLKQNPELYRKYIENNYKLDPSEDPRITKFGAFLRRTSLDELPQLFNVLKGDMSLVGPRPVVEEELQEYEHLMFDFLSVKPGVTGYWQVSGRSETGYPERVDIELYYVYNQSIALDLKILFKTIFAVLKRKGAY
ncbi:sugar transferase [Marinicrinis lubricantis]|uniref:Sugar transferase n=1 Tax=Marinicrinis lubricantis TaxID=2086470 RepID=A0ABW1IKE0_9BACL